MHAGHLNYIQLLKFSSIAVKIYPIAFVRFPPSYTSTHIFYQQKICKKFYCSKPD